MTLAAGSSSPLAKADPAVNFAGMPLGDLLAFIEKNGKTYEGAGAIPLYQLWIRANGPDHPRTAPAWFNLGVAFAGSGQRDHAITCYESALTARPDLYAASVNLGTLLEAMGRPDDARAVWRRALQPTEARTALLNNLGRLAETRRQLDEAERALYASLLAAPEQPDVIQHFVHLRQKLCRWPALTQDLPGLPPDALLRQSGPLAVLALTDDVGVQREVAAAWIARKTTPVAARLSPAAGYAHARLRIGYLSSDFCRHAMSYLIAELFERHDRSRFEVYGYCSSPEDGSAIRSRILGAFDKTTKIRDLPDADAAQIIRDDEIDVLIDLNGLTAGSRIQVLRYRPAPVQATYLGFVGPVPLPELDYMLCDDFTVPPDEAAGYAPAPLSLGSLYQANDTRLEIGATASRAETGLPQDKFVFCCFSNYYKITPAMFAAWMAILSKAPNSVLWFADDGSGASDALAARAAAAGIDPARLIFSAHTDPAAYLARMRLADIFLDTFPYNAGTVASDAIRMKLPLVTLAGRSFASRMASSLLHSVNATDGIAPDEKSYIEIATRMATDPVTYAAYKARFTDAAWLSVRVTSRASPSALSGQSRALRSRKRAVSGRRPDRRGSCAREQRDARSAIDGNYTPSPARRPP